MSDQTENTPSNRRDVLKTIPVLGAAGALAATGTLYGAHHASGEKMVHIPALDKSAQSQITPDKALQMLKDGNKRFTSGKMLKRDLMQQVKETGSGQYPHSVILGCIDSRVPPELVFDQGIGDIFTPRIAGNFINTDIIGSIEFATKLAGSKLVVVLGHTSCGAVKGACDQAVMGNLTQTLSNLSPAIYAVTDVKENRNSKNTTFVNKVAETNVKLTVQAMIDRSPVMQGLIKDGQLKIVGAMHDVKTGVVTFM